MSHKLFFSVIPFDFTLVTAERAVTGQGKRAYIVWELEGDIKAGIFGVRGNFFDFRISYVAGKGILDIKNAIINILGFALCEHLHTSFG